MTSLDINNWILFFTFLAILWYSFETLKMRKEIAQQKDIEQRPVLIIYKRTINNDEILRIRNIGRGIAFNIIINKIKLSDSADLTFKLGIYEPNILIPNEERNLEGQAYLKKIPVLFKGTKSLAVINPKYAKKNFTFKVIYEDILNKKWFSEVETLIDGVRLRKVGSE